MKKNQNFLPENLHFLVVKFSVYLNRHVFVMEEYIKILSKIFFFSGTVFTNSPNTATLLGMVKRQMAMTPLQELKKVTDFE